MKTNWKKSIVLTILLSLFLVPNAWAAVGDTFTSTYQNNTLKYTVIDATNNYVSVGASDEYMDDGRTPKYPIKSTLVIPDNVTYNDVIYTVTAIKDNAFYGCNQIISLTLPNELQSIGDYAFKKCTSLDTITILSDIGSIGKEAFSECKNLTTATFNGNVDTVGNNAFFTCHTLTTITFKKNVNVFSEFAFYGCTSLTDLQFLGNIGTIVKFAFYGCENLGTITFGGSVNTLQELSFYGCNNLTNIEFSSKTPPLLKNIVENINNITFTIPDVSINDYVQYWHNQELNIYEKSENIFFKEGLIYTISNNEASVRYGYSASSDLKIGDYVTHKNGYQYNITSVDSAAFYKTTYSSITLGNNVKTIGLQAFAMMENMEGKTITFPESIEFIDNNAFIKCASEYKFLSNTPPELGDYVYGIFSPKRASTPAEKEQQKINDGSTLFTIPCGANKNNAWSSGNWGYPFFTDFLEQGCQNLYITKQNENLTNLPNESNEDFGKIRYTRYFKAGVWETLYLPFEIESMLIEGADYKDYIWKSEADDGIAVFYLAKLVNGTTDFTIATSIEKGVPYVILFGEESHSEYYANHPVTFVSKENYNYIPNDWNQQKSPLTMYGNTTLQKKDIANAYYLGDDNNFKLTDSYTLNPFECYISPEQTQNIQTRKFAVRIRPQNDVTTDIPTIDTNQLFWYRNGNTLIIQTGGQPVSIYNINGALIQSFTEGQEQITMELTSGCYIINSAGTAQKIIF